MCTTNDNHVKYGSWDMKHDGHNFCHFGPLFAHLPPNNSKNQNFKNWKKCLEILSFYTLYHKCQLYDIWLLRYGAWQTKFFVLLDNILHFYPLKTLKIRILKKTKERPGDIILHMSAIIDNHVMYGSWDMKRDRQNFLSFWTVFCPFTPLKLWKMKILKKMNKRLGDIIILHKFTKNHDHVLYCPWDMACDRCNGYFLLWAVFPTFTPLKTQKNKMKKNEKKKKKTAWRYHRFTMAYLKLWSFDILFLRYGTWQM